ncbi:cupin domain-containing protein [Nocardia sp. NPDC004068]|uniref:cupin domain-containing protein n=1 Tax=Nocardia sp. NPDC004068 TaxID=3364303 RepID=UPI0036C80074
MAHTRIRRVVTGHDAEGKARVVDDAMVEPLTTDLIPGVAAYRLWGRDDHPTFPDDGSPRPAPTWFPPRNGSRFMINEIPPGTPTPHADLDLPAALADLERKMPGAMAVQEPGGDGMHTTDTIDYVMVVSGEVTLELDDGERTVLRAGDVVVQNGTRHGWRNHGTEPCVIVGVAVGAERVGAPTPMTDQ